jgi:hypothetical protein
MIINIINNIRFSHKFHPNSGMASFWGCFPESIEIKDDVIENKVKFYTDNIIEFDLKKGGDDLTAEEKEENIQLYS